MFPRSLVLPLLVIAACAPKRVHEEPVLSQGARVPDSEAVVEAARADAQRSSQGAVARRDNTTAAALADCASAVCEAVARGELALGMSEAQVLAATRITEGAWATRDAGGATIMVPASSGNAPHDAVAQVALVQLTDGRVRAYSYQESHGVRVVNDPADATTEGRATAAAEALLREGDDFTARGDLPHALDRYDRASILSPGNALVDYRIATVLDKQLRPVEALIRYQLFLHRLELEKIEATGRAYGYLAEAIAQARERVLVLEKR